MFETLVRIFGEIFAGQEPQRQLIPVRVEKKRTPFGRR